MIHTNNLIIKHKAGLLNLAEELGNISRACKVMAFHEIHFIDTKNLSKLAELTHSSISLEENLM
jgi:hypothetical protein